MRLVALLALWLVIACSASAEPAAAPACVVPPATDCKPLVDPPTFDAIHAQILRPTCASDGAACHSAGAPTTRMSFDDPNTAYAMLLDARVRPGDAACSPLEQRILATDPSYRMPRGTTPLSDAETCAITLWIDRGAMR